MLTNLYLIAWCCESVVSSDLEEGLRHFRRSIESPYKGVSSYLSTHTVYLYKIYTKIIIGGGGGGGGGGRGVMAILENGYRKTCFMRFCCVNKAKRLKNC